MGRHSLIFSVRANLVERGSGAHRIATHLRENDWDVEVIDFAAYWRLDQLQELSKSRITKDTVFIGFSSFFNHWNHILSAFTKWLKDTYPDIKIVLGGQSVALTKAENIDYWVDSFGEVAMLELAKSFAGNTPVGLKFDLNFLGTKKLIKAVTSYPAYPLESYKNILQTRDFVQPFEWLTTEFSRGCKFACDFCNFPILGVKGDYSRSKADFEYEMKYNYNKFGVKNYFVADETFNDSVEKIIKFADVAEKLKFKPFFSGFQRADLMVSKPESWEHIARLNFGGHYYGVESFNHQSAKVVKKGMHPDKLKQGLLDIKSYLKSKIFYRGTISLIVGLPHETKESMQSTKDWLLENWIDESLVVFPLDLTDLNTSETANSYTNVSKFSQDLLKYGIRKMDIDPAAWGDFQYRYNWRIGNYFADTFMWEHDTMNIFEAREISSDLQDMAQDILKTDCWALNTPAMNYNKNIDLATSDDLLNKPKTQSLINIVTSYKFIDDYIQKKLNL